MGTGSVIVKAEFIHGAGPTPDLPLPLQLYQRLLDDALDGIIIVDQHSMIRYLNRSMEALSGYDRRALCGRSLDVLIPPDGVSPHSQKIAGFVSGSSPSSILGHVRELELQRRSGERCAVEMKAVDLGGCEGHRFFGAFMSDISARKEMAARNQDLLSLLKQQALTDSLTGLLNRRAFEKEALGVLARSARSLTPVSVGIADVDHFKRINDRHGHAAGDAVLRAVAGAIIAVARDTDVVARLGGEEFGLIFANAGVEQARQVAERIRVAVARLRVPLDDAESMQVTISLGIAPLSGRDGLDHALGAADKALYQAKNGGRNRIEIDTNCGEGRVSSS